MDIVIDFDGTVVTHAYPHTGYEIGADVVLKELVANGHRLILFTMRCGESLVRAEAWFRTNNIPLYGIQCHPTQHTWTQSVKAYGQLYIDDAALGCPLVYPKNGNRPYADWIAIRKILVKMQLIKKPHKSLIR